MHRLSSLLLALCTGCGAVLASTSISGLDRGAVRPEEPDARLLCGGRPCEAAPLQREYDRRMSKVGYTVGTGIDAGLLALGIGLARNNGNTLSGVVLGISTVFLSFDIIGPLSNGGFGGTAEPWRLSQPVTADYRGRRIELEPADLLHDGNPLRTFSVAALQQRLQKDASVSAGSDCLRHTGAVPRGPEAVAAIFDAADEGSGLHPETIRYLSEVLRAGAAAVAPELRVVGRDVLTAGGTCDADCAARRIGATFVVSGSVRRQGGELRYSVRAAKAPSGAPLGEASASGKNLDELDAAVRKLAARLFGCRE
jgi:hypothetical protein